MRIVLSGTHCSGKTTLAHDFAAAHRDYVHIPEPYELLGELDDEPTIDDFHRQLEVSVETLRAYAPGAYVIAERSPLDFLAYILALHDLRRGRHAFPPIEPAVALAAAGLAHVDLLVVLPLNDSDGIVCPDDEDGELRDAMNERLLELITTDEFDLLSGGNVRVVEVEGSPRLRLAVIERALAGMG
jgi:hypothetical protein